MQNELKEKLQKLSEKFNADIDVISLKALCNMPESEENTFAITELLNRLIEKYPENEEILGLLPKKEKMSLEELVTLLEKKYPNNVEIIAVKALLALPEGEDKEKSIKQHLERFLEQNQEDEDIIEYLEDNAERPTIVDTIKEAIKESKKDAKEAARQHYLERNKREDGYDGLYSFQEIMLRFFDI